MSGATIKNMREGSKRAHVGGERVLQPEYPFQDFSSLSLPREQNIAYRGLLKAKRPTPCIFKRQSARENGKVWGVSAYTQEAIIDEIGENYG